MLRVLPAEREIIEQVAAEAKQASSTWIREQALVAARRAARRSGREVTVPRGALSVAVDVTARALEAAP